MGNQILPEMPILRFSRTKYLFFDTWQSFGAKLPWKARVVPVLSSNTAYSPCEAFVPALLTLGEKRLQDQMRIGHLKPTKLHLRECIHCSTISLQTGHYFHLGFCKAPKCKNNLFYNRRIVFVFVLFTTNNFINNWKNRLSTLKSQWY